ncbi:MAG: glycosyltransferase [Deltaproteobacteria bacterium]|nr:glycosyltransferase [Deltaproteobacteria bacterium]
MIHLLVRDRHPHGGMKTYAEGLVAVAGGTVTATQLASAEGLAPVAGDCVVFDDKVGPDGLTCIKRWDRTVGGGIACGVLLHSPLLQMDLSNELERTLMLLRDRGDGKPLDFVLCAERAMSRLIRAAAPELPTGWLPHCLPPRSLAAIPARVRDAPPSAPRMCWLPLTFADQDSRYRHKNTYCQLAAVMLARDTGEAPIRVATNFASPLLTRFAAYLAIPLQETGSMERTAFARFLDGVALGLCVSLSESFSYNAIELMIAGIPTVFGPTLSWAWSSAELVSLCGVEDPGAIEQIAQRVRTLLAEPATYRRAAHVGWEVAAETVEANHRRARELIQGLADPARRREALLR